MKTQVVALEVTVLTNHLLPKAPYLGAHERMLIGTYPLGCLAPQEY